MAIAMLAISVTFCEIIIYGNPKCTRFMMRHDYTHCTVITSTFIN